MTGKMKRFLLLTILLIVGRMYDGFTTYLYTPDLMKEANPFVTILGLGWISIVITQILLVGLVVSALYYYFFKYNPIYPTEKKLRFSEFASYLSFSNTNSFVKIFYFPPTNKNVLYASVGYIASMTLICAGYIVGSSTTLLLISEKYRAFYKHGIPTLLYGILIGLVIYFSYKFYDTQYQKYQSQKYQYPF